MIRKYADSGFATPVPASTTLASWVRSSRPRPVARLARCAAWVAAALALGACVDSGGPADTEPPRLLALDGALDVARVPVRARLAVRFSEPLGQEAWHSSDAVVLVLGTPSPSQLADLASPPATSPLVVPCQRYVVGADTLVLVPLRPLQAQTQYTIVATKLVRDQAGNRLTAAPAQLAFRTGGPRVRLLWPQGPVPEGVRTLLLAYDEPPVSADEPDAVRLESPYGVLEALRAEAPLQTPLLRAFTLERPLLAGGDYRLAIREGDDEAVLPLEVEGAPPAEAPDGKVKVTAFDGALEVSVALAGPAFARLWLGDSPDALAPRGAAGFGPELVLGALEIETGRRLHGRVEVWGACAESRFIPPLDAPPLFAVMHPRYDLQLNEVVTHAQRDWSDRTCLGRPTSCGVPFDALPGGGAHPGSADEWVELVNRSGQTLDLTAGPAPWRLRVFDGTPEALELIHGQVTVHFSPGSGWRALAPGAFLVVKTPGNSNDDARFDLIDPWGAVIDRVSLGRDGVPRGRGAGVEDEAVVRVHDVPGRWCRAPASPGGPNAPCAQSE